MAPDNLKDAFGATNVKSTDSLIDIVDAQWIADHAAFRGIWPDKITNSDFSDSEARSTKRRNRDGSARAVQSILLTNSVDATSDSNFNKLL